MFKKRLFYLFLLSCLLASFVHCKRAVDDETYNKQFIEFVKNSKPRMGVLRAGERIVWTKENINKQKNLASKQLELLEKWNVKRLNSANLKQFEHFSSKFQAFAQDSTYQNPIFWVEATYKNAQYFLRSEEAEKEKMEKLQHLMANPMPYYDAAKQQLGDVSLAKLDSAVHVQKEYLHFLFSEMQDSLLIFREKNAAFANNLKEEKIAAKDFYAFLFGLRFDKSEQ